MEKINFYQLFKRKTTSTFFIPEIDGLRFLAITMVIICHIQALYLPRTSSSMSFSTIEEFIRILMRNNSDSGVLLFFTISGFILMLPFARHHLFKERQTSLRKYYIRRLTRLEPPYILALFFLFTLKIIFQNKNGWELLPHLGASLLYLHTAIYSEMSKITPITWSLEVEIQFYLLAPLIANIFRINKKLRRLIIISTIIFIAVIQDSFNLSKFTFLGTAQYFAAGFLLCDFYLSKEKICISRSLIKPLGAILLFGLILVGTKDLPGKIIYPLLTFLFCHLVLHSDVWKEKFSNKWLTSIGGMCYSLYLLHFAIISFLGNKTFHIKIAESYILNFILQVMLLLPSILIISAIFFLIIEKPCMDPQWPRKILNKFKKEPSN